MQNPNEEVTRILEEIAAGDRSGFDRLLPIVYSELRELADRRLRDERRPDHTLQPTAIVHEVYLKLVDQREARLESRAHFFALAAHLIRRILIDHARRKRRLKRGGGAGARLSLERFDALTVNEVDELLAVDEALEELSALHERVGRVVELRYFGGLSHAEVAAALDVSLRTVEGDWAMAKAWLARRLEVNGG
ncbi:MAG: ECF-type sigma factor [Phycisphaerales bacterium]